MPLNENNFIFKLYADQPATLDAFRAWFYQYKSDNNWQEMFTKHICFQCLPVAMQIGIWMQFTFEQECKGSTDEFREFAIKYILMVAPMLTVEAEDEPPVTTPFWRDF